MHPLLSLLCRSGEGRAGRREGLAAVGRGTDGDGEWFGKNACREGVGGSGPNSLKIPLENPHLCQQQQWQSCQKNWELQPHCAPLPEKERTDARKLNLTVV